MTPMFQRLFALFALVLLASCSQEPATPTGDLYILSSPSGAIVEVNNEFFGTTPIEGEPAPSGPCLISVRKEGYQTEYLSLRVVTGQKISREVDLTPLSGLVLINSTPPGAGVTIGDAYMGETPLALHDIKLGTHRAVLRMTGYNPREIEFSVEDRIPHEQMVDLISNSGSLIVYSTPPGATVFVDGRNEGTTPFNLDRVQKGERNIALQLAGFQPYNRNVLIVPDETAQVDARLSPLPGSLSVVTLPTGGRVYVNGELQGEAPVNLAELAPGAYNVRVTMRGHADQERAVQVGRGQNVVEEFQMVRNSGTLQLVTRPAGVRVSVDGEYVGTTRAPEGRTDRVSLPLQVDMLSKGSHTLQLVREGYTFENKRFFIQQNEITALEETLDRKFIPDVLVRTGDGQDRTITGVLIRKHTNGDLEVEIRPGVFRTIFAREIVSVEPLKQEEELE